MTPRGATARGLTLVELLCVTLVLGLAASWVLVGATRSVSAASEMVFRSDLRDIDRQARLLARTGAPTALVLADDGASLAVVERDGEDVRTIATAAIAEGELFLDRTPEPGRVDYDARGRSVDYQVRLRLDDRILAWTVHGLTGHVTEDAS